MTHQTRSTKELIEELVRSTGSRDAPEAMRMKARELIDLHVASFGEPSLPINLDVLASLKGITRSSDFPVYSPDAELAPDGTGGMTMRVNPDRPETRQRFSIAHEISHTFFPDYSSKSWCRTDARFRDRENPEDYLEMLCDIGAAELLFPQPWFGRDAAAVTNATTLAGLASTYHASREATVRRYAETCPDSIAAVFFIWKLKPKQKGVVGQRNQTNFLGIDPDDEIRDAIRLRIEYTIPSERFAGEGHYLPKEKSVESEGPIYQAAATGQATDDECYLNFGQASGTYRVWAVPLWTPNEQLGAGGENSVVAVLRPLSVKSQKVKQQKRTESNLFDVF